MQSGYLPKELDGKIHFSDFVQFEEDWPITNRERGVLIDKSISGALSSEERKRLDALQLYADYNIDQVAPRPAHVLDELEERLVSGLLARGKDLRCSDLNTQPSRTRDDMPTRVTLITAAIAIGFATSLCLGVCIAFIVSNGTTVVRRSMSSTSFHLASILRANASTRTCSTPVRRAMKRRKPFCTYRTPVKLRFMIAFT